MGGVQVTQPAEKEKVMPALLWVRILVIADGDSRLLR
jgi:hypothetical protein